MSHDESERPARGSRRAVLGVALASCAVGFVLHRLLAGPPAGLPAGSPADLPTGPRADPPAGPPVAADISFEEAQSVFHDPQGRTVDAAAADRTDVGGADIGEADRGGEASEDIPREVLLGRSDRGRLLLVGFTERAADIRLLSAREATARERHAYDASLRASAPDGWMAGELAPEYDLDRAGARPNRFADRLARTRTVVLAPDVAAAFPSPEAVHAALRTLLRRPPG